MAKAKLKNTKGMRVRLDFGQGQDNPCFVAGGKKRYLVDEEYNGVGAVMVNGEIKDAHGNRYYAILEFDESSSGEYYGGLYFDLTPNGVELKEIIGNIGVHSYKYHAPLKCFDHHVGDDGWSV